MRYGLVGCSVLVVLLTACGGGSSAAPTAGQGSTASAAPERPAARNLSKQPGCFSAAVAVGSRPGEVRLTVSCDAPAKGDLVRFSVSRSGFAHVPRHLSVRGPGAESRYGSCGRRRKQVVDCQARAAGRVTIAGSLFVAPADRCSREISITVVEPSTCGGSTCPSGSSTRELWSGPPRGC